MRRQFDRSITNFLVHYRQLADSWTLYDNAGVVPSVIASEEQGQLQLNEVRRYNELVKSYAKND